MHMLLSKLIVVVTIASVTTSVSSNKNCIGSNNCPVWPREFDSPFGLYSPFPSIKNASSTFYYKFLENGTQAQLISYDNRCFPFVNAKSALKAMPCKLLFINSGIYLSQPKHDIEYYLNCTFVLAVDLAMLTLSVCGLIKSFFSKNVRNKSNK